VGDDLRNNDALGLWVPAFAGTTGNDLPDGRGAQIPVKPASQKYSYFPNFGFDV